MSVAVLARRLRVARSTVQARLERLESTGAIAGYTLRLGEAARGARICSICSGAFVLAYAGLALVRGRWAPLALVTCTVWAVLVNSLLDTGW